MNSAAMAMDCTEIRISIDDVALGTANAATEELVEKHVAGCTACSRELEKTRTALSAFDAQPEIEPSKDLLSDLLQQIEGNPVLADIGKPAPTPAPAVHPTPRRREYWNTWRKTAAILVVAILGFIFATSILSPQPVAQVNGGDLLRDGEPISPNDFWQIYADQTFSVAPRGQIVNLSLAAGGNALVQPGSAFRFNASDEFQLLHGTAFFSITPQGKGFRVTGISADSVVTGTEFQVSTHPDRGAETILTVREGTVRFLNPAGEVPVTAGEQSFAAPNRTPTNPVKVDADSVLAWTTGEAIPRLAVQLSGDTSFHRGRGELSVQLVNLSDLPIEISDPSLNGSYLLLRVEHETRGLAFLRLLKSSVRSSSGGDVDGDHVALAPGEARQLDIQAELPFTEKGQLRITAVYSSNSKSESDLPQWRGMEESEALKAYQSGP